MLVSYIVESFTTSEGKTAYVKYDLSTKSTYIRYDVNKEWTVFPNNQDQTSMQKLVNEFASLSS